MLKYPMLAESVHVRALPNNRNSCMIEYVRVFSDRESGFVRRNHEMAGEDGETEGEPARHEL